MGERQIFKLYRSGMEKIVDTIVMLLLVLFQGDFFKKSFFWNSNTLWAGIHFAAHSKYRILFLGGTAD